MVETYEIDSEMLFDFRKNACKNQSDGFDRGLWFDRKTNKFFRTCESKTTSYLFDNSDDIFLIVFVAGDNNANGFENVCEWCTGCDCKEEVFDDCLAESLDKWYPIHPLNWGTQEYEEIEFEEV